MPFSQQSIRASYDPKPYTIEYQIHDLDTQIKARNQFQTRRFPTAIQLISHSDSNSSIQNLQIRTKNKPKHQKKRKKKLSFLENKQVFRLVPDEQNETKLKTPQQPSQPNPFFCLSSQILSNQTIFPSTKVRQKKPTHTHTHTKDRKRSTCNGVQRASRENRALQNLP